MRSNEQRTEDDDAENTSAGDAQAKGRTMNESRAHTTNVEGWARTLAVADGPPRNNQPSRAVNILRFVQANRRKDARPLDCAPHFPDG